MTDLNKVGNVQQLGGIETSVLDNGPAKGSWIAWFNTGGGLRYKVAMDRSLDIVDAFFNAHSLSWLSHAGLTNPNPEGFHDLGWLATFSGGLVTTCGLSQVGYTEEDARAGQGCHGRISNIPATVESIIQPDPANGQMEMSVTATMLESRVFGPSLELRRTIFSTLGQANIRIQDRVTNRGNTSSPHMLMYHCNFGYPLVDEGTEIIYNGACRSRGLEMDDAIFNGADFKTCKPVLDVHSGGGEACGFIEMEADEEDRCTAGLVNRRLGLGVMMKYSKQQLPCLTNWQHWGAGEYVCALEPGTNFPVGQLQAKEQGALIMLEPGESRSCELEFEVLSDEGRINEFPDLG